MNIESNINNLRKKIYETITPLITNDYVHLDNPYHNNIGDALIWDGEYTFLKSIKHKCLNSSSKDSWVDRKIDSEIVILFHGGGNFGDLYRPIQEFRLNIINKYTNNRIVMFPQSIWYDDKSSIEKDAAIMANHPDLHLIARDKWSYDIMKKYFYRNNVYLLPDMAFCINGLHTQHSNINNGYLFLRRVDKEIAPSTPDSLNFACDIHDWPTYERKFYRFKIIGGLQKIQHIVGCKKIKLILGKIIDYYADNYIRKDLPKIGAELISKYETIVTTRLHGLILSVLLHKNIEYIDNTTGKLSAFVSTWLSDFDNVKKFN